MEKKINKQGEKTITLWYGDIDYFFSASPEVITEEMREKIDNGSMVLDINLNHDEQTCSWYFREGNRAYTSTEDVYPEVLECLSLLSQMNIKSLKTCLLSNQLACLMNENASIPDTAIDEFEENPFATIQKYKLK